MDGEGVDLLRNLPVFDEQPRYAAELGDVVRHEREAVRPGDGGDLQIVWANGGSENGEMGTNLPCFHARVIVERDRVKLLSELFNLLEVADPMCRSRSFCPINQFGQHDGTNHDFDRIFFLDPGNQFLITLSQPFNASIRIEQ